MIISSRAKRDRERLLAVGIVVVASFAFLVVAIVAAREEILRQAANHGSAGIVTTLLNLGVDPNARDGWNSDAMFYAAANGHTDVVSLLFNWGVDTNRSYRMGYTALSLASANGHLETVRFLVDKGSGTRNEDRMAAIDLATKYGHNDVVDFLTK